MAARSSVKERPVLVSTAHRGIFVGYTKDSAEAETMTLTRARMIVYHSSDSRGLVGIGVNGPGSGARVSPPVKSITLRDVTAVIEPERHAVDEWERGLWK